MGIDKIRRAYNYSVKRPAESERLMVSFKKGDSLHRHEHSFDM